jgi:hypothetical protein
MKDLKSMRRKLRRSASGWAAPDALRKSNRLISAFETAFAAGLSGKTRATDLREPSRKRGLFCSGAIFKISNLTEEIHGIFWNKAQGNRVSYLA